MTERSESLALITPEKQVGLQLRSFEDLVSFSDMYVKTDLCPKELRGKNHECVMRAARGSYHGLNFFQSVENIAIINGRACMWGDIVLGLVKSSGLLEYIEEDSFEKIKDQKFARCVVKRTGESKEAVRTFGIEDAKRAGLIGKAGTWTSYPPRMLQMRARGFALRDMFPDILKGLYLREEMETPVEPTPAVIVEEADPLMPVEAKIQSDSELPDTVDEKITCIDCGKPQTECECNDTDEASSPVTEELPEDTPPAASSDFDPTEDMPGHTEWLRLLKVRDHLVTANPGFSEKFFWSQVTRTETSDGETVTLDSRERAEEVHLSRLKRDGKSEAAVHFLQRARDIFPDAFEAAMQPDLYED